MLFCYFHQVTRFAHHPLKNYFKMKRSSLRQGVTLPPMFVHTTAAPSPKKLRIADNQPAILSYFRASRALVLARRSNSPPIHDVETRNFQALCSQLNPRLLADSRRRALIKHRRCSSNNNNTYNNGHVAAIHAPASKLRSYLRARMVRRRGRNEAEMQGEKVPTIRITKLDNGRFHRIGSIKWIDATAEQVSLPRIQQIFSSEKRKSYCGRYRNAERRVTKGTATVLEGPQPSRAQKVNQSLELRMEKDKTRASGEEEKRESLMRLSTGFGKWEDGEDEGLHIA